jgi:hypothetical protein
MDVIKDPFVLEFLDQTYPKPVAKVDPLAISPITPGPDLPAGRRSMRTTLNAAAAGRAGGRRRVRRCSAGAGRIV